MAAGRIIGWLLVLIAAAVAGFEFTAAIGAGQWRPMALGELWYRLHAASLNASQAGIQRHIAPWLWEPVITSVLLLPAWPVFALPGGLLIWFCRRRRRPRP